MSLFKIKSWWSTAGALPEKSTYNGLQSELCMKVDRVGPSCESDYIVVSEGSILRIHEPAGEFQASYLILESDLDEFILQVGTGKFIGGSEERQVIVLFSRAFTIFELHKRDGFTDIGNQVLLNAVIKCPLNQKACRLVCGNFGGIKNRELVCVQALDGGLSFYDQQVKLFHWSNNDIVMPGPIGYIGNTDCFIVCKSNWILEVYSYQQLNEFVQLSSRQPSKKLTPQWIYNAGEEIYSLQIIQTSNNFASIIVMGERHVYCFQDNGLLKFMKKFDFMPVCFWAYLIGWYYEPGARLLIMVASEDNKLLVYENTTLLWACELFLSPIAISRCFAKGLPGGVVILSEDGIVSCCYLGTDPDLSTVPLPQNNEQLDPQTVQYELEALEEQLQQLLGNKDSEDNQLDDKVIINLSIGSTNDNLNTTTGRFNKDITDSSRTLPIDVIISFKDTDIKNVQVTFFCIPPFCCTEKIFCLEEVNETEKLTAHIFLSNDLEISDVVLKVAVILTEETGKINVIQKTMVLPLCLMCELHEKMDSYKYGITLTLKEPLKVHHVLSELTKTPDFLHENAETTSYTLQYKSSKSTVSIATEQAVCHIRANHYSSMAAILQYLMLKTRNSESEIFQMETFNMEIIQHYLKTIEVHARARIVLQSHENELGVLQGQFTLIQKRLLVQYGSLPPGDCDALEFLMKDTFQKLSLTTKLIVSGRDDVRRAGSVVEATGRLIVLLLQLMKVDEPKIELLADTLSLGCFYNDHQDWQEAVSQSVTYVLQNLLSKSEKDREKLAPVTEQDSSLLNAVYLKRFMKQLKALFDRMLTDMDVKVLAHNRGNDRKSERVEEIVEVI